tara:strand:+ start:44510 stop:45061 length:552 start_codon:yes stop_codon:yes gene_type:complete
MSAPAVFGALKTGDLLLQPLSCWSCFLIEEQENTKFSHMGIYFNIDGEDLVLEAYGEVKLTPLADFLNRTEVGENVQVRRFKNINFLEKELIRIALPMVGLSYDNEFLWFNENQKGEKLYCSELAYKLFYKFYGEGLPLKPMSYDKNRKYWAKFFKDNIPDGKLGNSPGDFERSKLFETVGHL